MPAQPKCGCGINPQQITDLFKEEPAAKIEIKKLPAANENCLSTNSYVRPQRQRQGLGANPDDWHNYYLGLPDQQKHEVWREFYETNAKNSHYSSLFRKQVINPNNQCRPGCRLKVPRPPDNVKLIFSGQKPSAGKSGQKFSEKLTTGPRPRPSAPFIHWLLVWEWERSSFLYLCSAFLTRLSLLHLSSQPHVLNTPLIVSATSVSPTSTPEVIIPKINLEIPVSYAPPATMKISSRMIWRAG